MSSFHVDARISLKLECEMAIRLGDLILSSGTADKQLKALGHKLKNIEEEDSEDYDSFVPSKDYCKNFYDKEDKEKCGNEWKEVNVDTKKTRKIRWGMD